MWTHPHKRRRKELNAYEGTPPTRGNCWFQSELWLLTLCQIHTYGKTHIDRWAGIGTTLDYSSFCQCPLCSIWTAATHALVTSTRTSYSLETDNGNGAFSSYYQTSAKYQSALLWLGWWCFQAHTCDARETAYILKLNKMRHWNSFLSAWLKSFPGFSQDQSQPFNVTVLVIKGNTVVTQDILVLRLFFICAFCSDHFRENAATNQEWHLLHIALLGIQRYNFSSFKNEWKAMQSAFLLCQCPLGLTGKRKCCYHRNQSPF